MSNVSECTDLAFAGYVMALALPRPPGMSAELLPSRIITVCSCLTGLFPNTWSLSWTRESGDERAKEMARFGITRPFNELANVADAAFNSHGIVWPGFIQDETALRQLHGFLGGEADVVVLGVGLEGRHVRSLISYVKSCDPTDTSSLVSVLRKQRPMPENCRLLGFEPLVSDASEVPDHSWHCNYLSSLLFERHGTRPNAHGLLDDKDLAARFCEEVTAEKQGEPGLWLPWMLAEATVPH